MPRVKIDLPATFSFSCKIQVRITDINYGGHLGNDSVLSIIHEARVQYLQQLGYTELNLAGAGLIMADAAIEFKSEVFYGETITASVAAGAISKIGFDLYYKLENQENGNSKTIAIVKTGMICFDYAKKKIMAVPEEVRGKLEA
ncbi:MAG TPA: thioesterase family protein [Chitinophagaceae bacterium]|nr:thioesterase family protein [Chitinophagaceae bacterium]